MASKHGKKVTLSIIIVSYNTKNITKRCVESVINSLHSTSLSYEIVAVDNASKDGSPDMLRTYSEVLLIANKSNTGFGKANNLGFKAASGRYILFLNSDTVALDRAIEKLYSFFVLHEPEMQFLGGKLLNSDMSPQPSCGPFYTLSVIFCFIFLKGDSWGLTRNSPDRTTRCDWVSGACIFTTRENFEKAGMFDERIFMYMDEIDLLYRARQKGLLTYFFPDARFIHLGSASSGKRTYPVLQTFRGFVYFYRKYFNQSSTIFILKSMLQLKSLIAVVIGKLTRNSYLINTYEEAYKLVKMA